jgi:uncharacterized protein
MAQTARIGGPVHGVEPLAVLPSPAGRIGLAETPVLDDQVLAKASALRSGAWLFPSLIKSVSENRAPLRDFAIFNNWVMAKTETWNFAPNFREGNLFREEVDEFEDLSSWLGWPAIEVARRLLGSANATHRSLGLACLKSLLPVPEGAEEIDSLERIEPLAANCRTLVVGTFPNVRCWRDRGWPIALAEPSPTGEVDWDAIPSARSAELVVASGLVLLGGGLRDMVRSTPRAKARVLIGPSVPPSPALFRMGIHGLGFSMAGDAGSLSAFFRRGSLGLKGAPHGAVKKFHLWCKPGFVEGILGKWM